MRRRQTIYRLLKKRLINRRFFAVFATCLSRLSYLINKIAHILPRQKYFRMPIDI